jgi:hypothetical protein
MTDLEALAALLQLESRAGNPTTNFAAVAFTTKRKIRKLMGL